ncbi:MAG: DUF5818 domain-containing protein [Sphingobium sp.]|jgi:hypothetical protein|uniref:DUF5818 domain-containing protein n=1 Tax=Sphingobium sp. TaxID=1912891 RepID=UPI003BAE96F4
MTLGSTTRRAGVVELAPRGPVLIEPDGMRWRLAGDLKTEHLVGTTVTVEGTIAGAVIDVYYLAPRAELSTC